MYEPEVSGTLCCFGPIVTLEHSTELERVKILKYACTVLSIQAVQNSEQADYDVGLL